MAETRKIRMQDVATAAGVSRATASYVLNGKEHLIPPPTRQRVVDAAKQLNYRINRLAQNLTRRRSGLVGVVLPDLKSPFFGALADAIQEASNAVDLQPVFGIGPGSLEAGEKRTAVLRDVLEWGVDAALLWWEPGAFPDALCGEYIAEAGATPLVFLGSGPPPVPNATAAWFDLYHAGTLAVTHLSAQGHQHIAVLGGRRVMEDPRALAVQRILAELNLPEPLILAAETATAPLLPVTLAPLETGDAQAQDLGRLAVRTMLQNRQGHDRPTAIIAVNDLMALGAMRAVADLGLRIPHDISLISCDATWVAPNLSPALTAVHMPFHALAQAGARLLTNRLLTESNDANTMRITISPELVIRESVAAPHS